MYRRFLLLFILSCLFLNGCRQPLPTTTATPDGESTPVEQNGKPTPIPVPTLPRSTRESIAPMGEATINDMILNPVSFPVEMAVILEGELADRCVRFIEVKPFYVEDLIQLVVATERPINENCGTETVPFTATFNIPLHMMHPGRYTVTAGELEQHFDFNGAKSAPDQ